MLKLAIAATVSISISIATIADARSLNPALTHYSLEQPKSYLAAQQSKSTTNISQKDLQGIHKAVSNFFGDTNRKIAPDPEFSSVYHEYRLRGNTCFFIEVKSVKILSLSSTNAKINVDAEEQKYIVEIIQQQPPLLSFKKENNKDSLAKRVYPINLEKINQKWRIRTESGQLI
jgi:hypothetical protein